MALYTITDLASGHVEIGRFRGGHHRGGGGGRRWGRGYGDGYYYGDYYEPGWNVELIDEDELPEGIQIVR